MRSHPWLPQQLGGFLTAFLLFSTGHSQITTSSSSSSSSPTPSATHTPQYVHEPTLVEFDIIFPREGETYAPADQFPIVLAVRNPMAALAFRPTMGWFLLKDNGVGGETYTVENMLDTQSITELGFTEVNFHDPASFVLGNFSSDQNPYYFSYLTSQLNSTSAQESKYVLDWAISYWNCSDPFPYDPEHPMRGGIWGEGWQNFITFASVNFTIKDGGIVPDQAALTNDRCEADPEAATRDTVAGVTMRVSNEMWVEANLGAVNTTGDEYEDLGLFYRYDSAGVDYHICANLTNESWEELPANPCHNRLDEKAAASIAAELGLPTGTPGTPGTTKDDEDSAGYRLVPSMLWTVVVGVGLATLAHVAGQYPPNIAILSIPNSRSCFTKFPNRPFGVFPNAAHK
ncbi:hypothetical protein B0T20DRAFT_421055 [Sordaria brevicollis]|uniref:DUF7136 domain-containing protein n=1 Tax=Sordaria brevicollis TaxID=83679 RepID=A0AAE0P309_SORBR|nr:hypothetical protein B0T20DRAFT_421055 [Sordaria brevicollis]